MCNQEMGHTNRFSTSLPRWFPSRNPKSSVFNHPTNTGSAHGLDRYDARTVQELLGHKKVKTTMVDTEVLNRGGQGVRSPLDSLRKAVSSESGGIIRAAGRHKTVRLQTKRLPPGLASATSS